MKERAILLLITARWLTGSKARPSVFHLPLSYIVRPLELYFCHQQGVAVQVLKTKRCSVSHPVPVAPFVVWYQIIRRFCHPLSAREKLKRRVTAIDWVDSLRILNTLNCFVCFRSNFSSLSFHFLLDRRPLPVLRDSNPRPFSVSPSLFSLHSPTADLTR